MKRQLKKIQAILSFVIAISLLLSNIQIAVADRQPPPGVARQKANAPDPIRRAYHAETGMLTFLGASPSAPIVVDGVQAQSLTPQARAMALLEPFAREFGLQSTEQELTRQSFTELDGREVTHYQQVYNSVPVMGGELVVNATSEGELLSINGEVSPGLSLDVQPALSADEARDAALALAAETYQLSVADFEAGTPELTIYDSRLLEPDGTAPALVWRMDVRALNGSPINELVLVDAQDGHVTLHFNQIDTFWQSQSSQTEMLPEHATESTLESAPDEVIAQGVTWYVATTGNDANDCISPSTPCATINVAIGKATSGDTILVAVGTYTGSGEEVVYISKSITLSGGWNLDFTLQNAMSIVDGEGIRSGIYITGGEKGITVIIDHFIIENGDGDLRCDAGGITSYNAGTTFISNSIIESNKSTCSRGGGGIMLYGDATISNSAIDNNVGGGIYFGSNQHQIKINNSTISANVCKTTGNCRYGGGIFNDGYGLKISINNSTISNNAGVGIFTELEHGDIMLSNSILSGNFSDYFGVADCNGTLISNGFNLIGNNSGCTIIPENGDLVGTNLRPINPRLTPLQDNGGLTLTHALMAGSPAIDKGSPAIPGSNENACTTADQRGISRPVGTRCDIGAFEGSVPWLPSPLAKTYTANNTATLSGTLLCDQTTPNCTNGANPHADAAHKFAIGTYNFYAAQHLRDSVDNLGLVITSTVHFCSEVSCPYANAFWNGSQMIYGDAYGFPLADDVVAHELTHGVTQYESNLYYYFQSGAINESLSDVWGEFYDQSNGQGNDTIGVKWLMGEDVSGLGVIRSMSNPPAYGDPDSMTSANYYVGNDDNGGVHWNSGVNNKAAYLMVDGGTFNGKTITALGADKTLDIYYEAQTNLLTSMSDYGDLYNIIYQSCLNLIGKEGIVAGDCQEVRDATDAVKMNINHNNALPTTPNNGNFESGYGVGWVEYSSHGYQLVTYGPSLPPHSGNYFAWLGGDNNEFSVISQGVSLPRNAKLNFWYYLATTELGCNNDYGRVYINGELVSNWALCTATMTDGWRTYWVDLSAYGDSEVMLEIAAITDVLGYTGGDYFSNLFIDDVSIYDAVFVDVLPGHSAKSYIEAVYNAGVTGGCKLDPLMYCPNNYVLRSQMAVFLQRAKNGSAYAPPAATGIFADVPASNWFAPWIEQMYNDGITGGCTLSPLNYCPGNSVTRAQMAIFLLRAKYGAGYTPPDATGIFADVPATDWTAPWIEQLYKEGVTGGCTTVPLNYCPSKPVTRAQMAIFLVRAFNLPMP